VQHVFIDDATLEIKGFDLCAVTGAMPIHRVPDETIEALKDRCRAEDLRLRSEGIGRNTAGTVFFPIYDFTTKKEVTE